MNTVCSPDSLRYAVIEHLPSAKHVYDPVDHPPKQESQYGTVCIAARSEDAWKIAHLLCALQSGPHTYTVCPAEAVSNHEPNTDCASADDPLRANG